MESVLAAAITGFLTLVGALVSNSRNRAVMEYGIDALAEKVSKHNHVIGRTYALEQDMAGCTAVVAARSLPSSPSASRFSSSPSRKRTPW